MAPRLPTHSRTLALRLRRVAKGAASDVLGAISVAVMKLARTMDPDKASRIGGRIMRRVGPWLREDRIGRENLRAAFPEKSKAEIEDILGGAWENLGQMAGEFAHLDRLWDFDIERQTPGRIEFTEGTVDRFLRLRDDGKPALVFASHLANWEMPALAAASHGLDAAALYRGPSIDQVDRIVREIRQANMGILVPTTLDAPVKLAKLLERGVHVGMLVDQYHSRGIEVTMFGRKTLATSMLARLAHHIPAPIHGVRVIRLPGHRFRIDLTDEIEPVRNAEGVIDQAATTQKITNVIEGWVREYPEQWLWMHRRWR